MLLTDLNHDLPDRHLAWPDCYNVRDLGGLSTDEGRLTTWQAIVRADILNRLTPVGQQAMLDYGVRTVIDLRSPPEVTREPSTLRDSPWLSYLNLPLEKHDPHVSDLISQAETRGEVYCIVLDHYPDAIAAVMDAIVRAQPGGVVIHCHAGKDRTGIIVALLLRLAGVPPDAIADDYAVSQIRLWPLYEPLVSAAEKNDAVDFWLRQTATREMIQMLLRHVADRYGGVDHYLQSCGLSPDEITQLRGRLLA